MGARVLSPIFLLDRNWTVWFLQLGEVICLGYTTWIAMKFGANLANGVERLWLKFCDFIMDRFGDRNFSFIVGPAGQF